MIRILDGRDRETQDIIYDLNHPELEYTDERRIVCTGRYKKRRR